MRKYMGMTVVLASLTIAYGGDDVFNSRLYQRDGSTTTLLGGNVNLPAKGVWEIREQGKMINALRLCILPPKAVSDQFVGKRMTAVEKKRKTQQGRYLVSSLTSPCFEYAKKHDGRGPSSVSDLNEKRYSHVIKNISQSPWRGDDDKPLEGPFVFLVPNVPFKFDEKRRRVKREDREILALELHPYVDDGKHWVAYSDRSCERVMIDPNLAKQYDFVIKPALPKEADTPRKLPEKLTYTLIAIRRQDQRGPFSVSLENVVADGDKKRVVRWDPSSATAGDNSLLDDLNKARRRAWAPYFQASPSPVLATWMKAASGGSATVRDSGRRRGERASIFGVLGGRAAMRETLQMQVLAPNRGERERTIPIATIEGVKVKAHPYEQMLKGKQGGKLQLADFAPADHFFVAVAKPKALLPFLDDGADFLSSLGASITGNGVKYYLKSRYLARLGLNEKWLSLFLKAGAVKECALIAPDLFFIDGTDITVISRLAQFKLVAPLLQLIGVTDLTGDRVVKLAVGDGKSVFWAARDDLLIVSTSQAELDLVLNLKSARGKGSLGRSAEFRYMLTQLPVKENTRGYAYFSDPFVRHLVGPATKITQLRRMIARSRMEHITAAALLASLDGVRKASSMETLAALGYLPDNFLEEDTSIDKDLVVRSKTFGIPATLATLSEIGIENVSQWEANAYKEYVRNYTRFWRQFFDPIAIRLDDVDDSSLEATTFILPLIDSSIYNGLKEMVMSQEDGVALKTPRLAPDPVVMLSMNLKNEAWQKITEGLSELVTRYLRVSSAILDDLGPALHLAVHDADPVIALGSGDILGAFGGAASGNLGGGSSMMFIPIVLSVLTRPCSLAVETRHPEKTVMYLRRAATSGLAGAGRRDDEFGVRFYQIKGKDSWVCSFDIMGLIKFRVGLEVRDGFVMIRNIPWTSKDKVQRIEKADLNAIHLQVYPAACRLQLPGLHATASERQSAAAMRGAALLYPLLASGYAPMDTAAQKHMKLFGFMPYHPAGGEWTWANRDVVSTSYGSLKRREHPLYIDGDTDFGLMKNIQRLSIETQFEDTGLRAKIRWKTR